MLVFLDLLHDAVGVGDAIGEHGFEVFYIEHCDCSDGGVGRIEVGCRARKVGLTCFGTMQVALSCECRNNSALALNLIISIDGLPKETPVHLSWKQFGS